jgi:regulator of sigma E protease
LSDVLSSLLPFAIILVSLVVIHELGHFVTAKMAGVKVLEFGIGYPPKLFGIKRGETEYTLNLLPLGGFVRLLGEEDPTEPRSLASQPAPQRLVIMASGAFMNFVLAVALFSLALMIPREVPVGRPVISQVLPDSPAAQAGLQKGDIIERIDGRNVESILDVRKGIDLNRGEETPLVVRRTDPVTGESKTVELTVKPRWVAPDYVYEVKPGDTVESVSAATGFSRDLVRHIAGIKTSLPEGKELTIQYNGETFVHKVEKGETVEYLARLLRVSDEAVAAAAGLPDPNTLPPGTVLRFPQGATGIVLGSQYQFTETRSLDPLTALGRGWQSTLDVLKLTRNAVITWIKGGQAPFSGPIGIAQGTGEVFREAGWKSLMDLAAQLSLSLAVINILPLPMLDGGRMVFVILEILRRGRRIAPAKEALVHFVGLVAILILVVVLSYFDIARIVRGDSLIR